MGAKIRIKRKHIIGACLGISGAALLLGCAVSVWFLQVLDQRATEQTRNCATYNARPIPADVMADLCAASLVPDSMDGCDDTPAQLQDIDTIVKRSVTPNVTTHADVTSLFGSYEAYCDPQMSGLPSYRCTYNISGIGPNVSIFYDTQTQVVESIRTSACGAGS